MIPYGRQSITQEDIDAVEGVLRSDFITQGPMVPSFENHIAEFVGAENAIAVNSATSALHIACLSLGLTSGDWLWTSPISFVASANCGLYCGAKVSFVDIDPYTYNISIEKLEEKLIQAALSDALPKVVVVVHYAGQSCDMRSIKKLSDQYGFKIIEDASHAIGGKYEDKYIGSCFYSDITVFSFHPVKIITTAEGGIATTNSSSLATKMQLFRSHGITREKDKLLSDYEGDWYYEQIDLGFNYRMTDIQAALGISQLKTIKNNIEQRHFLANRYYQELSTLPMTLPYQSELSYSSYHLFPIKLHLDDIGFSRKEVFDRLRKMGVGVNVHYIPIHTQPYYKNLPYELGDYPVAENFYRQAMSIPLFHTMSYSQQSKVIDSLKQVIL